MYTKEQEQEANKVEDRCDSTWLYMRCERLKGHDDVEGDEDPTRHHADLGFVQGTW